ncbi:hypothetical protein, conserved [Plasmodium ovale curtisi]|uniref:START domain-containing protein n=1 Tax=Plasmodium ovale curtisi TaxID=864141 RepID=A0A1A8W0D2_PLAOA|nr:hypothetical protein, conserved [Plasmodium ovale curtisi]
MYNALFDYSYYFSLDRLNSTTSHSLSNAIDHNDSHNDSHNDRNVLFDNSNTNRKCSVQSYDISDLGRRCGDTNGGGPCNSSLKCFSITESENMSKINFPTTTKGGDSSHCVHNGGGQGSFFPQSEKDASVVASVGTINGIIQGEGKVGENNSGDNNSGDNNSGDNNSGDNNSGDNNSGDNNSGDNNSGDNNSGDNNSGDNNSGDNNSGDNNSGDNNSGDNNSGDNNSGDNDDCRSAGSPIRESQGGQSSPLQSYRPSSHNEDNGRDAHLDYHNISSLNNSKGEDEGDSKDDNSVIVDKLYHQHYNASNLLSSSKVSLNKKNNDLQNTINTKGSNRHMVKIIQKYSKRLKNFRKIKQDKEGWVKENDKYLDLWHRVDSENNISVHIRAKLPYEVKKILSILSETELSANWAPFLTSAKRIKHLSKSSAVIAQMYEYPIIGKKESLLYCLGANSLEELGCIILCCKAIPELKKDILFYEEMCEKLNINKEGEIITVKETPGKFRKKKKDITFFETKLPDPIPKIDRQRAANLCFLLYPLNDGKSTILELFVHFENEFKYTPIKMVTYFIKKIVKNMYENIIKSCKNYDLLYSERLKTNADFYVWLEDQLKKYMKCKHRTKLIDSVSLESYKEPESNEAALRSMVGGKEGSTIRFYFHWNKYIFVLIKSALYSSELFSARKGLIHVCS